MRDLLGSLEIAFTRFAGRVADHTRRSTGEGDRVVAEHLKTAKREEWDEVADVKRIGGRIEAAIKRDGAFRQTLGESGFIGAVGEQATPLQVFEDCHGSRVGRFVSKRGGV